MKIHLGLLTYFGAPENKSVDVSVTDPTLVSLFGEHLPLPRAWHFLVVTYYSLKQKHFVITPQIDVILYIFPSRVEVECSLVFKDLGSFYPLDCKVA